jgi:GNAT superfamily N-acetyltransferase
MKAELLEGKHVYKIFSKFGTDIYRDSPYYRGTEHSIEKLLLNSVSAFHSHAAAKLFVIRHENEIVARFSLIKDERQLGYVQVSFFEARAGLGDIFPLIRETILLHFPGCIKVVVGLNGHLNYGAGILLNRFDEVPLFGLPYNPPYYAGYFRNLQCHRMVTFRFSMENYRAWAETYAVDRELRGLSVRFMNKKEIKKESAIYTQLNNRAFVRHPFWADRDNEEDLELFNPFRFLLDNENLIIAEIDGQPVGFFLWYPDFNQLVSGSRDLNVWDVLKYRLGTRMDTFRFTEIGIVPEYQGSPVALALISKSLPVLLSKGYKYCEGGFIFEENKASIAFVKRILQRCEGSEPLPYREYAVFENTLHE